MTLTASSAYIRGLRRGYHLAGRSFARRFALAIAVWVLLAGSSLGMMWAGAEIFLANTTGEPVAKVVLSVWDSWNRVYGAPGGR